MGTGGHRCFPASRCWSPSSPLVGSAESSRGNTVAEVGAVSNGRIAANGDHPLLRVESLYVSATSGAGEIPLLRGIELVVPRGARVGVVGESGSGKSMTASAILRLLPPGVSITGGSIHFD